MVENGGRGHVAREESKHQRCWNVGSCFSVLIPAVHFGNVCKENARRD